MDWDINNQTVKILNMWSIVNTGGASNARHHHGNSDISAAYYVGLQKIVVILYFTILDQRLYFLTQNLTILIH